MEDKKEEKVKYHFKFISKEEFPKFIERFKEALEKTDNKKGEKNNFEIEIRGTRELLDGIQIEFFNFDETTYEDFIIDKEKDKENIKNGLYFVSLNLKIENESSIEEFKNNMFPAIKKTLDSIPLFKDYVDVFLTKKETKMSIYFVVKKGELMNSLLSLGIDFTKYHSFNFGLFTSINFLELFEEWKNPFNLIKLFSFIFSFKSERIDFRYLLTALAEALKDVKINDYKIKKHYVKFINFLSYLICFNNAKFKFEFNAREFVEGLVKNSENNEVEKKLMQFGGIQKFFVDYFKQKIFPFIKYMSLENLFKENNFDDISLSLCFPKYQNGFALLFHLPHLSKFVNELFETTPNK